MKNFLQWFFDKHNKETLRQHLVRGTLWSFVIKALSTFLVFLISVVLARLLGPDGLGQYAFAIALVQLLVLPGTLGTPQLIVREVSAKALSSSWGEIRALLRRVNQSTLIISILLVLLGFSLTWYFGESEERQSMYVIWLALLLIPMRVVTRIKTALIRGLRHVVLSQIPMLLFRPLLFLIFLLIFHWVCDDVLKTNTAILFQIMATGLALVTILAFARYSKPKQIDIAEPVYKTSKWLKSALPFLVIGSMQIINNQTDIIMLGFLTEPHEVGLYRVAQRGSELVIFSLTAVNMAIAPTVSRLYAHGEIERLQKILSKSVRKVMLFSLPMALIMVLAGKYVLIYVFGNEFALARYALAVLSGAQLINACMGSVGLILNMTGNEKDTAIVLASTAGLNICLNALLIPLYGILGAAIATSICLVSWNIMLKIIVNKKIELNTSFFE